MDGPKDIGNVLLVEDNPGDIRLTEELFNEAGGHSTIHAVTDGGEALDFIQQRNGHEDAPHPDLILIDWHLPKMSGGEILDEAREAADLSDVPLVVLTGSGAGVERIRKEVEAADKVLTKPIDPDEFPSTIESL
ncbi:response regulator [Haloterrigena alkaliphila]|uniref:response regulator n=1 Tax=Haloterrigena alkaliphila TaxID=2816475 RepID=UPI001D000720|nr:response regulator [Haloterrigena alkaliphila]UHQ95109.1 response regulator [Haloterrigena alkaliphila]